MLAFPDSSNLQAEDWRAGSERGIGFGPIPKRSSLRPSLRGLRQAAARSLWKLSEYQVQRFSHGQCEWLFKFTVNVWIPNWFGIQTPGFSSIPDSSDLGCCLKLELENPKPNAVSYLSIWTGRIWFKWPKSCMKSEFPSVRISALFRFWSFSIQTFTV